MATSTISPASRPTVFELPKDISFLGFQTPSFPSRSSDSGSNVSSSSESCDVICQRMEDSLERAKNRARAIIHRVHREDFKAKSPVVYEACRLALEVEMSRMLDQADLLLEDAKVDNDEDVSKLTKNKRLSVALINTLQYLDTLESAITFSSRERLEEKLLTVLNSIASKRSLDLTEDDLNVCVSSYKSPQLAFDFRAGSLSTECIDESGEDFEALPLNVAAKPIVEFTADELIEKRSPQAEAYNVKVLKCSHKKRECGAREGAGGEALIKIHVCPLAESMKNKNEVVWGLNDDVEKVNVREVRA